MEGTLVVSSPAPCLVMNFPCFSHGCCLLHFPHASLRRAWCCLVYTLPLGVFAFAVCKSASPLGWVNPAASASSVKHPGKTCWGDTHSCTHVLCIPDLNTFPMEKVWFNSSTCNRNGTKSFTLPGCCPHCPCTELWEQLQPHRSRLPADTILWIAPSWQGVEGAFSATCRKVFFF